MRFLIVEDDFVSRRVLQRFLEGYGESDVAVDGNEAINAFSLAVEEQKPYDAVFLDIMMPAQDGHGVLKAIRTLEGERNVKGLERCRVIMTTALADAANIMGSFREECDAYLTKPIQKEKFISTIQELGLTTTRST